MNTISLTILLPPYAHYVKDVPRMQKYEGHCPNKPQYVPQDVPLPHINPLTITTSKKQVVDSASLLIKGRVLSAEK